MYITVAKLLIEELRNQVAIKRGPIVYCLESTDLPDGVKVSDIVIPLNIKLQPRFDGDLLGGITVLEGKAEVFEGADWSNQLYRQLMLEKPKKVAVGLIPYYAWANRGISEMTVWLPLGR